MDKYTRERKGSWKKTQVACDYRKKGLKRVSEFLSFRFSERTK